MWITIAEAVLAILGILSALALIFTPAGRKNLSNFITNVVGGALDVAVPLLDGLEGALAPIAQAFVNSLNTHGAGIINVFRDPAAAVARNAFKAAENTMINRVSYLPEDAPDAAAAALGNAFGFGLGAAGVAALYEAVFPEKLNTFDAAAPILGEMAGFKEVITHVLDPLYEKAFGKNLEYHYNNVFKPEFADEGDAVQWHSRRLLSEDDLREVFKYSGLKAKYEEAYVQSAYRAIQPRALVSLVQDTVFPTDDMTKLLEFAGIRPVDIARVLPLMEANSTKNLRNQYLAALLNAAERGNLDQPTLDLKLNDLNFSATAKNLVHLTVAVKRLQQLDELYRKSVSIGYRYGEIPDAQYVPLLEAAGIGAADAQAHYDIDSEIVRGKALAAAERAALREHEKLAALKIATTREEFLKGNIDAIAMAAGVTASGIPLTLVPSTIALLTAQGAARKVNIYGLLLDPPAATLLREKVAAVKEQVLKKVLTIDAARATLDSFNLPGANVQALLSEWSAQAYKTVLPV